MRGGGLQKFVLYIFDIPIHSYCSEQIYSTFVFGQVPGSKYIRYSYSVHLLGKNIFDIRIRYAVWDMNIFNIDKSSLNLFTFITNKINYFLKSF